MPATALRCRSCETDVALEAVGVCPSASRRSSPVYDRDELARTATRERIAAGPPSIWRYAPLLPVEPPAEQRLAPGPDAARPAPRLAAELGVRRALAQARHGEPDPLLQGPCRGGRLRESPGARPDTLSCSSTGNLANAVAARAAAEGLEAAVFCPRDLEPEKLVATAVYGATIYAVDGSYDDCSRLTVELSFELDWAFVNVGLRAYYAEGSKTLAYEIAEQLGWRSPDVVVAPIASGALFSKLHKGFAEFAALGLLEGFAPRLVGGQAEGCSPVATAFAQERRVVPVRPKTIARSLAIGSPADGDLAARTARESGGAIYAVAEEEVGANMASSPRPPASSARRPPASRSERCARQCGWDASARTTRSSCSSPGTG